MVVGVGGGYDFRELSRFSTRLVTGRWFMVVATFLVMSTSGTGYIFGLYSPVIKSSLGYDQTTLNLLSFFKDLGSNAGVHAGLLMEFTPPWVVLIVGSVLNFGYFMIWLAVTKRIAKPPIWLMFFYICIGANSTAFTNTAAIIPCVKNFPESRGVVLGLLKGFVGLSAGIYTQLYLAFYGTNAKSLILLISWLPVVFSIVFLRTIRFMKHIEPVKGSEKVFYQFLYVSFGLAGFLMVMTLLQQRFVFTRIEFISSGVGVLLVLFSLFFVAFREEYELWKYELEYNNAPSANENSHVMSPVISERPMCEFAETQCRKGDSCFQNIFRPPNRGEDYTILQALFSIDMITLLVTSICGLGGALAAIDNLGQIGESLGYSESSVRTCVSLVSIWNYLGRVMAGFVSEHLLNKYKFPRPLMLTITLLLTCVGHLLIAFGVKNGLYISSIIIGFCFGAQWPMIYAIISELFGLKYYSTLYNVGTIASPIGGYFFNVRLTGYLYDKEARKQLRVTGRVREAGEELICDGPKCFGLAFIIIACVTAFGMFTSIVLVMRTKKFYHSDIYKKFRDDKSDETEMNEGDAVSHEHRAK